MKFYIKFKDKVWPVVCDRLSIARSMIPTLLKVIFNKQFIMRVNLTIAILIAMFIQVSASSYGQRVTVNEKNTTLKSLFQKIELQSGYDFVYNPQMLNEAKRVDVNLKNATVEHALTVIFKNQPLTYTLDQGVVVVKRKKIQNVQSSQSNTQQQTITGRITDEGNLALPGVTVQVKGTQTTTSTNADGRYSINAESGSTLVFTMLGFKRLEHGITTATVLNLKMEEDSRTLDDVTVNTGYQTISKKLFTGAATSVKGADVKLEGTVDVSRMLEGRVAGVSVQNVSGTFGSAPKVRVRGATSISGENKPLWVVDGVVLEDVVNVSNDQLSSGDPLTLIGSSVAGINADDIESFEILKDASATALYGARAMNGVIVITTKKGRIGKPLTSYSGNFSSYLKPSYDSYNILNSRDQMSVYAELSRKGLLNYAPSLRSSTGGVYTKMAQLIDTYDPVSGKYGVENTPEGKAAFLKRYAQANTDWFDILFKNSFVQEHSLSISSGTEHVQNYFSASFYDDKGWTIADNVKRYTANLRSDYKLSEKLTAGVIVSGSIRDQVTPGSQGRSNNVVAGEYSRDFDINPFSYALNTSRALTAFQQNGDLEYFDVLPTYKSFVGDDNLEYFTNYYAPFNIINELKNNKIELNVLDLKIQGEANYKFSKHFKYTALGAMRYVKTTRESMITEYSNMASAYRAAYNSSVISANRFLYSDPDYPNQYKQVVLPEGGFYLRNDDFLKNYYGRHTLTYNQTFGDKHIVSGLAGQEIKFAHRQNSYSNGYGYQFDKGGVPFTDYRIIKQTLEGNYDYYGMKYNWDRYVSLFGNLSYSYDGKYVFSGTARYDGSNRTGRLKSARYLPTWTLSGAWNVDSESFMDNATAVDFLKVRATYGLTASLGNATNSTVVLTNTSTLRPSLSETESKIRISQLGNSELTWEKQFETNVGMDLGLWRNKVTLSVDAYKRNGFDLIGGLRTSGIGGQATKNANFANMDSKGIEVTLGNRVVKNSSWEYRTNFTFGYNTNKITDLKTLPRIYDLVVPEGGAKENGTVRGLYSINYLGLDPATGVPYFINEKGEEGYGVYVQSTNTDHLIYEGSVDPTITGGFSNVVKYKSFNLNVFFTYQAGNKIRLNPAFKSSYGDLDAMPLEFLNRWTLPGDEKLTDIPSIMDPRTRAELGSSYPYNAYNFSTARVADGSFIRLKNVALNYTIPERLSKSAGIGSASLALNATNLWLVYADSKLMGQDPEFFNSGGVALPMPKQFTLTLRIGI